MDDTDLITWSEKYYLKWSDFLAEQNPSAFEDSFSKIKYHHKWTVHSEMKEGKIYFVIDQVHLSTLFLRHLSWVRKQNSSDDLLRHEQGHFDLAESLKPMIVEKIQSEFKNKCFLTRGQNEEQRKQFAREDSGMLIGKELEKWNQFLLEKRNQYDQDTDYGNNLKKQKEYDEFFARLRKNIK